MVSPLSRSVSVINCPRVELSSLFNHMVSLLLASSNSPILVNSEGFYPIIFLYGFILCFTMTVSVFIWSLSSTPSVLVFLEGSSLADLLFLISSSLLFCGFPAQILAVNFTCCYFHRFFLYYLKLDFSIVFMLTQCLLLYLYCLFTFSLLFLFLFTLFVPHRFVYFISAGNFINRKEISSST